MHLDDDNNDPLCFRYHSIPPNFSKGLLMMELRKHKKTYGSPWERHPPDESLNHRLDEQKFLSRCYENRYLDISTKAAAIKASEYVVSVVTFSDDVKMCQGTGTIIEEGTILTSAKLVACPTIENAVAKNLKVTVYLWDGKPHEAKLSAYDFHYDIAFLKIREDVELLKLACLRLVDDHISINPCELHICDESRFQLRPGNKVIALGRYFSEPYDLMAAPGEFSIIRFDQKYEYKELLRTTCSITETGLGGPIINHHGEVIGVTSYDFMFTPFLPINIALKWWEHWKISKLPRQPLLGMELANLYTLDVQLIEKHKLKYPDMVAGVIVERVKQGSPADTAELRPNDFIVECCGIPVRSIIEFFDMFWDKTGDSVELAVLRPTEDDQLYLTMEVIDARQSTECKESTSKKRKESKKESKRKKRME